MGLAEKRKIKEYQDTIIPSRQQVVTEMTGAMIQYDVKWESFEDFDSLNFFDNCGLYRVEMALRMICVDDMSKEAIQEGLSSVSFENVKDKADNTISFSGGVLEMRCAYGQRLDGVILEGEIKKVIEDGL